MNIVHIEEWTHREPHPQPNQQLLKDLRQMALEIARLRKIERAADAVIRHHAAGHVALHHGTACQAMTALGAALITQPVWRQP